MVRRRHFLSLVGGAILVRPITARAQPMRKLPIIGVLGPDASAWNGWIAPFEQRLREFGWTGGRTATIDYRWSGGRSERVTEIATEFAQLKADVIVTSGGSLTAVRRAAPDVPVVFAFAQDPLTSGFVKNLARPEGNVTGLSVQNADSAGKRLELLRQLLPDLRRLAVMANGDCAAAAHELDVVTAAARALGIEVAPLEVRQADDIATVFAARRGDTQALYVCSDALVAANHARINGLALDARMPTMYAVGELVKAGGLMSYGANYPDLFWRAGEYVDKILRGAKPADLPVGQPATFQFVINLKTAKALDLTVPPPLVTQADAVIE